MPPIPLVTGICSPLPSPIEFKKSDEKDELVRGILTEKKKKKKKKTRLFESWTKTKKWAAKKITGA
jgi:hypothetical protein